VRMRTRSYQHHSASRCSLFQQSASTSISSASSCHRRHVNTIVHRAITKNFICEFADQSSIRLIRSPSHNLTNANNYTDNQNNHSHPLYSHSHVTWCLISLYLLHVTSFVSPKALPPTYFVNFAYFALVPIFPNFCADLQHGG